ncbi:Hypothetical protein HVR_LOCUS127 [uncultured virus]|nr:Hypothetical protein HVR_LOCUS127 [uncultured virus]
MENFSRVTIGIKGAGLTNQIGYLIVGIIKSYRKNKRFVLLQDFNTNFSTDSRVPLGEIIDLSHLNSYLQKFGLYVFDSTAKINILSVKYGFEFNISNITEKAIGLFKKGNSFFIPKGYQLNNLNGDPAPEKYKTLCIEYSIGNKHHSVSYPEHRDSDISFDLNDAELFDRGCWIDLFDVQQYNDILSNIKFNEKFYHFSDKFIGVFIEKFSEQTETSSLVSQETNLKINAIHVRDDNDAIDFWSKINHMSEVSFSSQLTNKYARLIDEYFDVNDPVIVITSNLKSPVIKYLSDKGYKYFISDKQTEGRETDGIVDLLISQHCNNVFIGNYNVALYRGSTFSYFVDLCLSKDVTKVMLDLDNIIAPTTIHK